MALDACLSSHQQDPSCAGPVTKPVAFMLHEVFEKCFASNIMAVPGQVG